MRGKELLTFLVILVILGGGVSSFSYRNLTRTKRLIECGFQCKSDNKCLHISKECNGIVDCADGSDETDCKNNWCPKYLFRCNSGACINKDAVCNGKQDCSDNSDETGPDCGTPQPTCRKDQFQCKNNECIDFRYECNGRADCTDQSDETHHCISQFCLPFLFRCNYGACINFQSKCNGVIDCVDGSDESEAVCGSTTKRPVPVTPSWTPPPIPATPKPTPATEGPILENGDCILPNQPENGKLYLISGSYVPLTRVNPGTLIRLVCDARYGPTSDRMYSICFDGKWDETLECKQSCKSISSSKTMRVNCTYGDKSRSCENAIEGTLLNFSCEPFYENTGTDSWSYCSGGFWSHTPKCTPVCGQKTVKSAQLSVGGTKVVKGDYPWQVGLFKNIDGSFTNICGGSLLNERIILTAAHCVATESIEQSTVSTDIKEFKVAVGKYYRILDHPDDIYAQIRNVSKIWYPEMYRGSLQHYIGDIALIQAETPFTMTKHVQPICFDKSNILTLEPGQYGVVTGWGYTQHGGQPSDELHEIKIPYEDSALCKTRLPTDFVRLFFGFDKFCAGYYNSSKALCEGDPGGALVFKHTDGKYYVKGIMSPAPRVQGSCDIQQYALFTNIDYYAEDMSRFILKYS
ncbi:modular serine protease isoform X2 [Aethina tumida]|uniref:modular serine protease isoform X2 n=1 Tax=Aethina tumida TaxID=116153 RepID=UPI00214968A9|nr:modular serine protease isoform X2 [Aethina tumida]